MTSEEWIANIPSEQDRKYAREAVNAALEKEREGEDSVVVVIKPDGTSEQYWGHEAAGKRVRLIARPTKAKEAGL